MSKEEDIEITTINGFDVIRGRRKISNITNIRQPASCKRDDQKRFRYSRYAGQKSNKVIITSDMPFEGYDDIRKLRDKVTIKDEYEVLPT